jgi:hypothetical protein
MLLAECDRRAVNPLPETASRDALASIGMCSDSIYRRPRPDVIGGMWDTRLKSAALMCLSADWHFAGDAWDGGRFAHQYRTTAVANRQSHVRLI